ncbi:MAG: DUF4339 domain-containing protein [Verrucomicrobia bacterium]|nr:DUF4339 domain-containing protein [Verrucomicrobiota bacterium]
MNIWKYVHNGQTFGPVEIEQLQRLVDSGMLTRESLLQKEGSTEWVPAHSLPELNFPAAGTPPSPPVTAFSSAAPPPISDKTPDLEDVEKNKIFAILAYIGLLFIVPLLAAPNSKFARYHANQGIVLFLATVILLAGSMVLMMIPIVGCVMWIAPFVIVAGAIVLMVLGIINAAAGQCKPLPLIGQFNLLK